MTDEQKNKDILDQFVADNLPMKMLKHFLRKFDKIKPRYCSRFQIDPIEDVSYDDMVDDCIKFYLANR